jgi:hypothetical protein
LKAVADQELLVLRQSTVNLKLNNSKRKGSCLAITEK